MIELKLILLYFVRAEREGLGFAGPRGLQDMAVTSPSVPLCNQRPIPENFLKQ